MKVLKMKNKGLYWIKFASQASSQKHLGLTLDKRLTFDKHLKNVSNKKRQKKIGLLQKLQNILPKSALLTIYKCFIRPNLDQLILYYFKNNILQFIRTSPSKIFQCHNPEGIKLVTILRLGLRLSLKINCSFTFFQIYCFCRARVVARRYQLWYLFGFRHVYIER